MKLFDLFLTCQCAITLFLLVSLASVCGQESLGVDQWQAGEEVMYYPIYVENSKDRQVHEWFTKLLTGITLTLAITAFLAKSGGNVNTYHMNGIESMNGGGLPPPS